MQLQVADEQLVHAAGVTGREAVEFTLSGGEGGVRQGDGWGGRGMESLGTINKNILGERFTLTNKNKVQEFHFFFSSFQIVAAPASIILEAQAENLGGALLSNISSHFHCISDYFANECRNYSFLNFQNSDRSEIFLD